MAEISESSPIARRVFVLAVEWLNIIKPTPFQKINANSGVRLLEP